MVRSFELSIDRLGQIDYSIDMTTSYTECCRSEIVTGEEEVPGIFWNEGKTVTVSYRACASCGARSPRRVYVTTRKTRSGGKSECGGACLNGKTSCDCKCNGRCHGAGRCQCGEEVA